MADLEILLGAWGLFSANSVRVPKAMSCVLFANILQHIVVYGYSMNGLSPMCDVESAIIDLIGFSMVGAAGGHLLRSAFCSLAKFSCKVALALLNECLRMNA